MHRDEHEDPPLYVRYCPDCGFQEESPDPSLLWLFLACPICEPQPARKLPRAA